MMHQDEEKYEMKWVVPFEDDCLNELRSSLLMGPILLHEGQELRSLNEGFVGATNGLKIYIYANEHPPAHFHVKYGGEQNSFRISDGVPLYPNNGLQNYFRNIHKWFMKNRKILIECWNNTRPDDCPVGKI